MVTVEAENSTPDPTVKIHHPTKPTPNPYRFKNKAINSKPNKTHQHKQNSQQLINLAPNKQNLQVQPTQPTQRPSTTQNK